MYNIDMTEQAFVYKWTHLPSLKWYVGSRTARGCHPNDGYICSSRTVKPMIESNPDQWRRDIIATGTSKEMREFEQEILIIFDAVHEPRSFNRSNGGGRGIIEKHTETAKEKIRQYQLANSKGEKNHMYGKPAWNKGISKKTHPDLNWGGVKVGEKRPGIGGVKKGTRKGLPGTPSKFKGIPRSPEIIAKIKATKALNKNKSNKTNFCNLETTLNATSNQTFLDCVPDPAQS